MGDGRINKGVAIPGAASVTLTTPRPDFLSGRSERCVCPLDKRSLLTLIDQVSSGLGHASCPASGANAAALTGVCDQFFMMALITTHAQKAMG